MSRQRSRIVFGLLTFFFFLIWLRLAYWQLGKTGFLSKLFERQSSRRVKISPQLGKIISSDGYLLATNQSLIKVGFNPQKCREQGQVIINNYLNFQEKEMKRTAMSFQKVIKKDKRYLDYLNTDKINQATSSAYWQNQKIKLYKRLNNKHLKWLELNPVDESFLSTLDSKAKNCLYQIPFWQRSYPDKRLDGHFLGFRGFNNKGSLQGYFGLEGFYNNELSGLAGWKVEELDAIGQIIPHFLDFYKPPLNGRDLHLFLSYNFQYLTQKALIDGVRKYQAQSGTIIILNPQNMAVLAMASYPFYQPARYSWYKQKAFLNPAVGQLYEPGSTFKTLIMALGLKLGKIKPESKCPVCGQPLVTQGGTIRTWNDKYYPDSTMTEVLVHSDNVGMAWLADRIGKNKLYEFLVDAGFGQKSGIDLQDDQVNPLRPLPQWYPINVMTAGFGQGIFLTPIKLAQLEATIARGGVMIPPRMVNYLTEGKKHYSIKIPWSKKLFSAKVSREVTQMMVKVVNEGSVKWTKIAGLEIAGKTGTAQVAVNGHYDYHKTIASFVGFWPVEKPKYLILVKLDYPQASPWGSETAAPIFFKLARQINIIGLSN